VEVVLEVEVVDVDDLLEVVLDEVLVDVEVDVDDLLELEVEEEVLVEVDDLLVVDDEDVLEDVDVVEWLVEVVVVVDVVAGDEVERMKFAWYCESVHIHCCSVGQFQSCHDDCPEPPAPA